MKLPRGPTTDWDMTKLTDEQLKHEYDLAYEILNGVYIDGELIVKGMLFKESDSDMFPEALRVWKLRLERAKDKLIDRMILS